jgi:hypothetical protein
MKKSLWFGMALTAMLACEVQASKLINFDDLSGGGGVIPDGYQALHWTNFFYVSGISQPNTGYFPATISTNNVGFNGAGSAAFLGSPALDSGYFTAVWRDGLQLEVIGMRNGATVAGDDHTFTLNSTNATFLTFNYTNIDTIKFVTSGGIRNPSYSGDGTQFAVDNLSVPEPATTTVLLAFGASMVGMRRRNRAG